ncbi:hypothetical protein M9458_008233, partial [Cirrhinus mrigala]
VFLVSVSEEWSGAGAGNGKPGAELERSGYKMLGAQRGNCCCSTPLTYSGDYILQFRTLAGTSGWNEAALLIAYRQGLDPHIRAQMSIYDDTVGLKNYMQRATRISQCLFTCQPKEAAHQPTTPAVGPPVPELMQARLQLPHSCRVRSLPIDWTLFVLRCNGPLHQGLPRQTPTPCSEYPSTRPRNLNFISVTSATNELDLWYIESYIMIMFIFIKILFLLLGS